ncbi:MAG: hypothetical protein KDD89_07045 [Anaerolineales bacterium]|nr:hypothetical protein [Anaerolineales bacterium]
MSQELALPQPSANNPESESFTKKLSADMLTKLAEFINDANEQDAADRVASLRQTLPEATDQELIDRLVYDKCIQAATSGAVTAGTALIPGIGPALALTFGVATDIGVTFKLQAELVLEIAAVYGQKIDDEEKRTILLGVTGVNMGSDFVARRLGRVVATRATKLLAGQAAVKAIPYLGVAASAGMNIALTYAVGQRAIAYFGSTEHQSLQTWDDTIRALTGVDRDKLAQWLSEAVLQAYALLYPDDDPQPATTAEATSMVVANVSDAAEDLRQQARESWLATKSRLRDSVNESDYFSPEAKQVLSKALSWQAPKAADMLPKALKKKLEAATDEPETLEVVALLTPHDTPNEAVSEQIAQAQAHLAAHGEDLFLFAEDEADETEELTVTDMAEDEPVESGSG